MRWLAIVALLLAGRANAEPDAGDRKQIAKRLFDEGRVLYDQGKYIEACVLFEKSNQLDPAIGTRLNLAECAEREGKPRAAWLLWISAVEEFEEDSDPRARFARKRADALAPKLATVVVRVAKPRRKGLEIEIAGRRVKPSAEIVERVDVSRIVIAATAPKREPFSTTVSVAVGDKLEVDLPALKRMDGMEEPEPRSTRPTKVWWGLAAGSAAITTGAIIYFRYAQGRVSDFEGMSGMELGDDPIRIAERDRQGELWASRANVAALTSVIGGGLATVFVIKAMLVARKHDRAHTSLRLAPAIAPRVAGLQLDLRW